MSIEQAAEQLGRAKSTTAGYLSDYLTARLITDASPWVEPATIDRVVAAWRELGCEGRLTPLHEKLAGEVDYDALRIVLTCERNRGIAKRTEPS
ncbi:MAG: helix-turn-helix domain-containing protein [Planctomycetaceae bacterium]